MNETLNCRGDRQRSMDGSPRDLIYIYIYIYIYKYELYIYMSRCISSYRCPDLMEISIVGPPKASNFQLLSVGFICRYVNHVQEAGSYIYLYIYIQAFQAIGVPTEWKFKCIFNCRGKSI